jgi:cyclophilin family peptidyl-prolyl cis-trans isomerase
MKLLKYGSIVFLAAVCAISFFACSSGSRADSGMKLGEQLEAPAKGEEIAVLTTSMGTIKLRLFPKAAPKAVENFKGLIQKGYYNGLTFHRVINDFMVQTGDPTGTGSGGESIWNKPFEDEFNAGLVNIRGAVAMANSGKNTNGSQFFIDQAGPSTFQGWDQFEQGYSYFKKSKMTSSDFARQYGSTWLNMDKVTQEYRSFYEKNGGNPHLDGYYNIAGTGHTVFGQVFEGMDVVDKIAAVEVDSNDKPISAVTIVKAEIQKYGE